MLRALWSRLPARTRGQPAARLRAHCRPAVELLEDRRVLSPIALVGDIGTTTVLTSGAPGTEQLTIPVPARGVALGDTVLVEVSGDGASPTLSDTQGNSYARDVAAGGGPGIPSFLSFSARVGTALTSADHITVTFPGPTVPSVAAASAAEFSGLAVTPKDQLSTNAGTGTAATSNAAPATTAAKELLLGGVAVSSFSTAPLTIALTPGAGYTALPSASGSLFTGAAYVNTAVLPEFRIVQATGAYEADGTITGAAAPATLPSWTAGVVTYKGADQTTHFSVTASTAAPQAGVPFSVTVTALDAAGATATGYTGTVHLGSTDGQATLPADLTFTGAEGGTRTFSVTLRSAGSQTVTATDTDPAVGFTASTAPLNVTGAPAAATAGTGSPGTSTPGTGTPGTGIPGAGTGVTGTPTQRLVAQFYRDLLNRPVDPTGLTFWTAAIDGGLSRTEAVKAIAHSTEYLTDEIQAGYTLYLHRPLDPAGWAFYFPILLGGAPVEQIDMLILGSPEFLKVRNISNGDAFLDIVYHDVFNRKVDAAGQAAWDTAFAAGATFTGVAGVMFGSREYHLDLAAGDFARFLRRPLDPLGTLAFVLALDGGARTDDVLAVIVGSAEYAARV